MKLISILYYNLNPRLYTIPMEYYGFSFKDRDCGGLGALLHDVMMAAKYAQEQKLTLCFVQDGYEIPRLNGAISDDSIPDHTWHTFFNTIPILQRHHCVGMWPTLLPNRFQSEKWNMEQYHTLLNKLCDFHPSIQAHIQSLVDKTPFNEETDVVIHIRQTDKLVEVSDFVSLDVYIRECEHALQAGALTRIYICTDDQFVCNYIHQHFKSKQVEVVWDNQESILPLHTFRIHNQLTKLDAQQETFNAFKNIMIMKKAKYLIGGRMSYFFRIGELLGKHTTVNIQDNEKFGIAPYSEKDYPMRPCFSKHIPKFVNPSIPWNQYRDEYQRTGIVSIPSFISPDKTVELVKKVKQFSWWTYSTRTSEIVNYDNAVQLDPKRVEECNQYHENKYFCYRFKRSHGSHYNTCVCGFCLLEQTFKSFQVTDALCKVVGCRNLTPNEMFLSKYEKGDFLSIHHDIKKGDLSVTCSLTEDWDVSWGGILHFCNESGIYKSISPKLGTLNLFKLDPENGLDHFVSTVNVNKARYTFTAWYSIES